MNADSDKKASLFVTCLVDQLNPEVGVSVVRILRRLGVEVDFPPGQTCCGQPLFNSGFTKDASLLARRVLQSFSPGGQDVVVPSGSCAAMIRIFYPQLFHDDPELRRTAEELAGKVYEFSEFLVKVLGADYVESEFKGKVAYHPSCHLMRELAVSEEPKRLIGNVKGARLVEMEQAEACCGFGGTFSVKYLHISASMLDDNVEAVVKTGAKTLTACDMGCFMQIGGALSRRGIDVQPMHLAQLLEFAPELQRHGD